MGLINAIGVGVPFHIPGGGAAFSGLLDTYGSATVAYSLRRLSSTYSGSLIRVREDSGNTETDIGYDSNGDLDTAAIASHCGANNGFVVKWYDQSGNANDAGQVTAGNQAKIYNGSTTLTDPNNGNVAIQFDGSADHYDLSNIATTQLCYYSWVMNRASTGIRTLGLTGSTSSPFAFMWATNDGLYTALVAATNSLHDSSQTGTGDFLVTVLRDSSNNVKVWRNGSADTTQTYANSADNFDTISLRSGQYHNGYMQELIYWNSDQESNRSGIETDVNGYWGVF